MSPKTTRGVTWENQILCSHWHGCVSWGTQRAEHGHCSAHWCQTRKDKHHETCECSLQFSSQSSRGLWPLPFCLFLSILLSLRYSVVRISCPPHGLSVCSRVDPAPICIAPAHWALETWAETNTRNKSLVTRSFLNTFHWANRVLNGQIYRLVINDVNVNHCLFLSLCVYFMGIL